MTKKEIALDFEKLILAAKIDEAYEKYISPDFKHHNPYFKGDRESLLHGMKENAGQFATRIYETQRAIEEGDLVMTHALMRFKPDTPEISVVHIYEFHGDKIVEEWDLAQSAPDNSPNENGLF